MDLGHAKLDEPCWTLAGTLLAFWLRSADICAGATTGGPLRSIAAALFSVTEVGRADMPHRSCAGSVGSGAGRIVLGYYGGFSVYSITSLELLFETWAIVPDDCAVSGVAPRKEGLWLLGQHLALSPGEPPKDWQQELMLLPWEDLRRVEKRVPLGPGNWQFASNQPDGALVVYDRTEGQGVRVLDPVSGTLTTLVPGVSLRRLDRFDTDLVGLVTDAHGAPVKLLRWTGSETPPLIE